MAYELYLYKPFNNEYIRVCMFELYIFQNDAMQTGDNIGYS